METSPPWYSLKLHGSRYTWMVFLFAYLGLLITCLVGLFLVDPHGEISVTSENSLIDATTRRPLRAGSKLHRIPQEFFWGASLSALEEVKLELNGPSGNPYELRLDVRGGFFDPQRNVTTLRLSLGQSLVVTPGLTALFDEHRNLVAVTPNLPNGFPPKARCVATTGRGTEVDNGSDRVGTAKVGEEGGEGEGGGEAVQRETTSPPKLGADCVPPSVAEVAAGILNQALLLANPVGSLNVMNEEAATRLAPSMGISPGPSRAVWESDNLGRLVRATEANALTEVVSVEMERGSARRLGLAKKNKGDHKINTMKPPGYFGTMPFPYPYPFPMTSPPIYTRPEPPVAPVPQIFQQPAMQPTQVVTLLRQPQLVQPVVSALQPVMPTAFQPVAPVAAPQAPVTPTNGATPSAGGISQGDLDIISELIKTSNTELKEDILDLTLDPNDVNVQAVPGVITRDSLISMEALDILSNAVSGYRGERRPERTERQEEILDLSFSPEDTTDHKDAYVNGFQDGYRNGYGDGVETGEDVVTSLWCSIDGQHPLCSTVNK